MARKKTVKCKILSNKQVAKDHFAVEIESAYLAKNSSPGQFVSVRVRETGTYPLLRIPLGVHAIRKNSIILLYKVVGEGTAMLSSRQKNETLNVLGPLGNGFDLEKFKKEGFKKAIIVAGGHGIAPLYALAEKLVSQNKKVEVFLGACTREHVVGARELRAKGIKVHVATEDGTCGHKGYVTDPLKQALIKDTVKITGAMIFACGPRPMLAALSKDARMYGIPAQVSLDAYMACGVGACLGCAVRTKSGYKMVCKDGPVFDAQQIDWKTEKSK
jgi:dihydroorotate dehydrogenase electron transfer subunit